MILLRTLLLLLHLLPTYSLYDYRYRDILNTKEKNKDNFQSIDYTDATDDVEELFLEQRLDHFDANNVATFQQRYFVTKRYLIPDSNFEVTFLCVGGEGPGFTQSVLIDSDHCTGDLLLSAQRLAKDYGISVNVYALEHRYYGSSYPDFGEGESPVSNKNLKYLSSRQALEDLAHFVDNMNEKHGKITKWVTFGGSYPGIMAANARLKYPHMIYAAVANSAPILFEVDYPEYNQVVASDLAYDKIGGSQVCHDIVKQGHNQAVALLEKNHSALGEMFNVCEPDRLQHRRNQELLLGDGLIGIPAQSNDPSCKGDLCNIQNLCHFMTNASSNSSALEILANIAKMQQRSSECMQVDWNATLLELSSPIVTNGGWRSWLWQTCTEFGFYQTCDDSCPYASAFHSVDMDLEICKVAFNITNVYENVQDSINYYGGLDVSDASRILYTNGDVDPWSALGLQDSPKDSVPAVLVKGASHHAWTHRVSAEDLPEIVVVREYIYSKVKNWLDVDQTKSLRGERITSTF